MIIYPPLIADTISAFTTEQIVIPFSQNPAVSMNEVTGFQLMIKDYIKSEVIGYLHVGKESNAVKYNANTQSGEIMFNITGISPLSPSQYYKFQLAYDDNSNYFAYSTTSIGRCIGEVPQVYIDELNDGSILINLNRYTGVYAATLSSEPMYSYRFTLSTLEGEIVQDTGEVRYNTEYYVLDEETNLWTGKNIFDIRTQLKSGQYYKLKYTITTINSYTTSKEYTILEAGATPSPFNGELVVSQNTKAKENGYVDIQLNTAVGYQYRGDFILERSANLQEWDRLTEFHINYKSDISKYKWRDMSVEHGITYTYAIRQYANNQYSARICAQPITIEFEDMFLTDGNKQLKIQYNPKVSSFKNTILEQKTDTIGSQYPFIFRNGMVKYKELALSGLISYQMDKDNFFDSGLNQQEFTSDLANNTYAIERDFKLQVLEWLNNGKPKLFRSPAEGSYIVRLLNISLSPNDTLGRMLHTFSSTAYEIEENTMTNLQKYQLIQFPTIAETKPTRITETWSPVIEGDSFIDYDISNIYWHTNIPSASADKHYIELDNNKYYNTTNVFTTPNDIVFHSITIPQGFVTKEGQSDTIMFEYQPVWSNEELGTDNFSDVLNNSVDLLFSIPAGKTLWGEHGVFEEKDANGNLLVTFYKTYMLVVRKDPNSTSTDYTFTLNNQDIDCSDGQIRYYYDIGPDDKYEKGLGLHVDIYAKVNKLSLTSSNELGKFILNTSKLG